MQTGDRLVSFGGNTIRISSDDPSILKVIDAHFACCSAKIGTEITHYHIAATAERNFSLSLGGRVLYSDLSFEYALQNLMQDVLTHLNGDCDMGPVFHAAALEIDNKGVILCGQSRSGKSSLAAWLVANGLHYLTDEVIVYHQEDGNISGFPRSLVLKSGSAFIWQRWLRDINADGFYHFSDGTAWIDPALLHKEGISLQAKPSLLVFPRYSPGVSIGIEKLSPAETLFYLLQNLVNARNLPNHSMDAATHLARQVKAFKLVYSDIEGATEWIKQTALTL